MGWIGKWFGVVLVTVALAGCATMRPEECMVADWYLIGELDAREGRTSSHFARRARDCADAGYPADQASWYEGWEHGLVHFCTRQRGYRFARNGHDYESICPASLEADFLLGYELGRQTYQAEQEVNRIGQQLESMDRELREQIQDGTLGEEELTELRREQRRLDRRLREAELRLAELTGRAQGQGLL